MAKALTTYNSNSGRQAHRPSYDIISHGAINLPDKHAYYSDKKVTPHRSFVISEFYHRQNSPKFHSEFKQALEKNPTNIYSQKVGEFNHHAQQMPLMKNVIRNDRTLPNTKPWLKA